MNLSIFNFSNKPYKKKVIITALLLFFIVSALETILRYYDYPHPQRLNNLSEDRTFPIPVEKLPDAIVIIGNSRMMNGLTPEVMHQHLKAQGDDTMVYNIAYAGTWTISFLAALDSLGIYPKRLIISHSSVANTNDWKYQAATLETQLLAPTAPTKLKSQEKIELYLKYLVNRHIVLTNYQYPIWSFLLGIKAISKGADLNDTLFNFGINPYFSTQGIYDKYGFDGEIIKLKKPYFSGGREKVYQRHLERMKRWKIQTPPDMWSEYGNFFKRFSAKGTKFVAVILPMAKNVYDFEYIESGDIMQIQELCQRHDIPLIDYNSSNSKFAYQSYDGGHIDYETAVKVSQEVAAYLLRE